MLAILTVVKNRKYSMIKINSSAIPYIVPYDLKTPQKTKKNHRWKHHLGILGI